ncbi:MAG: LNS2 (Lipin/Ned1/Smp2) [Rhodocyclaceae bacterium]|nr:MAG: LNS2 (Lipin/Ned1/Smp2) [Rhodocyclaceae bacterium]TND00236.1 MAG: LNS2 (Lipin/Ned1/Smp2) [Rhodocyclaceae bacterium]
MRTFIVVLLAIVGSGCARLPAQNVPPARQTKAVVFDIDGTLTPQVFAIFEAREDAARAVRIFADKGYKIIYLSKRFSWFQSGVPGWLHKHGFPEGSIQLSQSDYDDEHARDFKLRILKSFKYRGWKVQYAYGDSATDFEAYADAKISHVFALQRRGEDKCEHGSYKECLTGWTQHLDFIAKSVPSVLDD